MNFKIPHKLRAARRTQAKKLCVKGREATLKPKASIWSSGSLLRNPQSARFAHVPADFGTEAELRTLAGKRSWKKQISTPRHKRDAEEAAKIIRRVTPWAGSSDQASAWYRSQPIPAFGNRTAEALVRAGKAKVVHAYLDSIALGGFA